MPMPNCDVCGKPAKGVCSSSMGAVSIALCQECLTKGLEPWWVLVGNALTYDELAEWAKPTYDAIMKYYNKTPEDLSREIDELLAEMDRRIRELEKEEGE